MRKNDYDVMDSTDKESAKLDMIEITCKNCGAVNSIKNNTANSGAYEQCKDILIRPKPIILKISLLKL